MKKRKKEYRDADHNCNRRMHVIHLEDSEKLLSDLKLNKAKAYIKKLEEMVNHFQLDSDKKQRE